MKELTLDWLGDFLHVYSNEDVTPYILKFVFYLHEFKELYSEFNLTINEFNLEGLEKHMIFQQINIIIAPIVLLSIV